MANLGSNFYPKLVQISSELGMKPEDLILVMVSESGINPQALEKKFKGSGLMGFMPSTLDKLGFKGTWEDFIKLNGEQQLEYVKRLVKSNMAFNGGPFTSAAQYYVGNFWPLALKLPGIRNGDPSTPFIEEHPQITMDSKTGKKYSKKYYDLGYKISPGSESAAYKINTLFHGSVPGAITYGDMMKQVEKNKSSPIYQKAVNALKEQAGYQVKPENMPKPKSQKSPILSKKPTENLEHMLERYLQLAASDRNSYKKLYAFLPQHNYLIKINSENYTDKVEFARILSAVLKEELMATTNTYANNKKVELECSICGPSKECLAAVEQLIKSTAEAFKIATIKIGGIEVKNELITNKKSSYRNIDLKTVDEQYKKFLLKFKETE